MLVLISNLYAWFSENINTIILGALGSIVAVIIVSIFNTTILRFIKRLIKAVSKMFHKSTKKINSSVTTNVSESSESNNGIVTVSPPVVPYPTTTFFHYRLTDAFPRLDNGITQFNDRRTIIKRLKILLGEPLTFSTDVLRAGYDSSPIWWFRGTYNLSIEKFQVLKKCKVLINIDEYVVTKLIVYKSKHIYRDFIYVECDPDKPSGAYTLSIEDIDRNVKEFGYCQEEYGLYKNRVLTRREYDESSTLIHGKPTITSGAKLRSRFLTKFNFIIAAKHSPYNSNTFDRYSEEYFNNLLTNQIDFKEFLKWMLSLERNPRDMWND